MGQGLRSRVWGLGLEFGGYRTTLVSLSLRLKDLVGPVTRVKKKKKLPHERVVDVDGEEVRGRGVHPPVVLAWCGLWRSGLREKEIHTPMARGRSTKIISMIKWIRTSRLSIKDSLSRVCDLGVEV